MTIFDVIQHGYLIGFGIIGLAALVLCGAGYLIGRAGLADAVAKAAKEGFADGQKHERQQRRERLASANTEVLSRAAIANYQARRESRWHRTN